MSRPTPTPHHTLANRHAVVIGGGITGLAAALVLARRGAQVTVLERDPAQSVISPTEAFTAWERAGAPQVRHSHVFLGRLRALLRDQYPDVLEAILAAGARELRMTDRPPPALQGMTPEAGDEDLVAIGCRRTTFEWVLRQRVLAQGGVRFVPGATVLGLVSASPEGELSGQRPLLPPPLAEKLAGEGPRAAPVARLGENGLDISGVPPRVVGVRYRRLHGDAGADSVRTLPSSAQEGMTPGASGTDDACILEADLVIDASGRRSDAPAWLSAIGAAKPEEESEPSGVVYYTRFYQLEPGAAEPVPGKHPTAADFNWVKYAVFPADDRTFSLTLAVPLAFPRLKILAKPAAFDAMVRAIPALVPWVAEGVARPLEQGKNAVRAMGGLVNRLRRYVGDGGPLAVGFHVLGDAAYCTNPLYGRGCAQGFLHAHFLGEALDEAGADPIETAKALDRRARETLEPFYRASVLADRDAVRKAEGRAPRRLSARWRVRFFEEGIGPATRCDPVVFRAFLRMMNMLETPEQAFGRPEVILRALLVMARGKARNQRHAPPPPPDQEATIALCEAAGG